VVRRIARDPGRPKAPPRCPRPVSRPHTSSTRCDGSRPRLTSHSTILSPTRTKSRTSREPSSRSRSANKREGGVRWSRAGRGEGPASLRPETRARRALPASSAPRSWPHFRARDRRGSGEPRSRTRPYGRGARSAPGEGLGSRRRQRARAWKGGGCSEAAGYSASPRGSTDYLSGRSR
jgi:hypothetical protein